MPQASIELAETHDSITRPVVMDIIRQVNKLTRAPVGTRLQYMGDIGATYLAGSDMVASDEKEFNTFTSSNKMRVDVTEEPDQEHGTMLTMNTWQKDNIAIFHDHSLGVTITPIYARYSATINFEFRTENATIADRFRNDLRIKAAQGRQDNLHEVDYGYTFPPEFIFILRQIYDLRETVAGYGDDFEEYLEQFASRKLTTVVNQAGKEPRLVVGEKQIQVLGWFEFEGVPEKATNSNEGPARTMNFSYRFLYDKVIGCHIEYPLVIHNQMVPDIMYDEEPPYDPTQRIRAPSYHRFLLDQYTGLFPTRGCCLDGISIPTHDDWLPDRVPPDTNTMLSAITLGDPEFPQYLFHLDDLGDWVIDEDIMAFIMADRFNIARYGQSLLHINFYDGGVPLSDGAIYIDDDFAVMAKEPLDFRRRYHARLGVLNNLMLMDRRAVDRVRKHGKAVIKIFKQLQCGFPHGMYVPELLPDGSISYSDWMEVARRLAAYKGMFYNGIEHAMMTVGTYNLITYTATPQEIKDYAAGKSPGSTQQEAGSGQAGNAAGSGQSRVSYCERGHATYPPLLTSDVHSRQIVDG